MGASSDRREDSEAVSRMEGLLSTLDVHNLSIMLLFALCFLYTVLSAIYVMHLIDDDQVYFSENAVLAVAFYYLPDSSFPRIPPILGKKGENIGKLWTIPDQTFNDLKYVASRAPVNPRTGKKCIHTAVVNEGMIDFTLNMICSLRLTGVPYNSLVVLALDMASYNAMDAIGAQVVYQPSNFTTDAVNNRKMVPYCRLLKVRPTLLWQFLLWDIEVILTDSDIVFLQNPSDYFNDMSDFESQMDSDKLVYIPSNITDPVWEVNAGFFKIRPTPAVLAFMPIWMGDLYKHMRTHDQASLKGCLHKRRRHWINEDTFFINTGGMLGSAPGLSVRYLDPMQICNAGGVHISGKDRWIAEAKRRGLKRPKMIHYFHCSMIKQKRKLMVRNDLWFVTPERQCVDKPTKASVTWPLWA